MAESERGATVVPASSRSIQIVNISGSAVAQIGNNYNTCQANPRDIPGGIDPLPPASRAEHASRYSYRSTQPIKTFVARPALQDAIHDQLTRALPDGGQGTRVVAVTGLGGTGKTQLVLNYLQRYQAAYQTTFWVDAGEPSSVERDFVNIYCQLFDRTLSDGARTLDAESAILGVKSWISSATTASLLVLDNADAIDNPQDRNYVDLSRLIPNSSVAHVLITSRSDAAQGLSSFEGVEVRELEVPQAMELFSKAAKLGDRGAAAQSHIRAIIEELGCLALAVNLAGTYVSHSARLSLHLEKYLPEYRQRRRKLLDLKPNPLVHRYGESVMTTWEASFAAVRARSLEASRLLTLLAFLDNHDIFLDLFCLDGNAVKPSDLRWPSAIWDSREGDIYELENCFSTLESFSLIQRDPSNNAYAMHTLVHAWSRHRISEEPAEETRFCSAAFELLQSAVARCSRDRRDRLRLVPHLMVNFAAIKENASRAGSARSGAWKGFDQISDFVYDTGQWSNAILIQRFVVEEMTKLPGKDSGDSFWAMLKLANALTDQQEATEALAIQAELLEKLRKLGGGDDHFDTLVVLNSMANTLAVQGRFEKACNVQEEVVQKTRQMLGDANPNTLSAMYNLANRLYAVGRYKEAEETQNEVLEKSRKFLGADHLFTIDTLDNIARRLAAQGKSEQAVEGHKQVLEARGRVLGVDHPDTLNSLRDLGATLAAQGKWDEAVKRQLDVLERLGRLFESDHPDILKTMSIIAMIRGSQGRFEEASSIYKDVAERWTKTLGEYHPHTLVALNNLGNALSDQGKFAEALRLQKGVLEQRKRILGKDHTRTLDTLNDIGNTLTSQGRSDEALGILEEVLEQRTRILGADHADTLKAAHNLANILRLQGRLEEALRSQKQVLEKRKKILGDDHVDTVGTMASIAITLYNQGRLNEALRIHEEVIERRRATLGSDHPATISYMNNHAFMLGGLGKWGEAARIQEEAVEKSRRILSNAHPIALVAMDNLVDMLYNEGKCDEARRTMERVWEERRRSLGENHYATIKAKESLDDMTGGKPRTSCAIVFTGDGRFMEI